MLHNDLKFGVFLAPHRLEDHDEARRQDMDLIDYLDKLGYNHAWISAQDWADNEIAAILERTTDISLGIRVIPTPRPHSAHEMDPKILAERILQLAKLGGARVEFGIGSGTPSPDTLKSGTAHRSNMLLEILQAKVPLSIAAQVSPAGAGLAGRCGLGLISLAATSPGGFNALPVTWEIYSRKARENNQQISRCHWSLVGPIHIAKTHQQALKNISYGLENWAKYFHEVAALPLVPLGKTAEMAQALVDNGLAVIGSPRDAIRQLQRLQERSGGFGCFLQLDHNWADREQTRKSYHLFAEQVAPVFRGQFT
jgi:limonene 1,2-monooxygenase